MSRMVPFGGGAARGFTMMDPSDSDEEIPDLMSFFLRAPIPPRSMRSQRRVHVATPPPPHHHRHPYLAAAAAAGRDVQTPLPIPNPFAAARSYATNVADNTAGRVPENPLEIADDSDEDSEVEVVQVTRPA